MTIVERLVKNRPPPGFDKSYRMALHMLKHVTASVLPMEKGRAELKEGAKFRIVHSTRDSD